jgi:hypothetical protein
LDDWWVSASTAAVQTATDDGGSSAENLAPSLLFFQSFRYGFSHYGLSNRLILCTGVYPGNNLKVMHWLFSIPKRLRI